LAPWPLFVTTADHALLTADTVDAFLGTVRASDDVAVGLVSRAVVRRRFPGNKRTWLRFGDGQFTGANMFALTGPRSLAALGFWAEVEQDRKKGWRLLAKLGPGLLLRALLRRLSMQGALDASAAAGRHRARGDAGGPAGGGRRRQAGRPRTRHRGSRRPRLDGA
jgi:hypothetical protein